MKVKMKVGADLKDDVFEDIFSERNARRNKKSYIILFRVAEPNQNLLPYTREEPAKTSGTNPLNSVLPDEHFE